MIRVTKLNGEVFLLNEEQVKYISFIPETKIFMMSDDYYLVKESGEEVLRLIVDFKRKIFPPVMSLEEVQREGLL